MNQNWPSILSNLKKNDQKMNKEAFISLLKLNSIKTENEIRSVTKRQEVTNPKKKEIPIINFGNEKMRVILDRTYKMDGNEMEEITDNTDAKNKTVREVSKKTDLI